MGWVSLRSSHGTVITSERDPPPPALLWLQNVNRRWACGERAKRSSPNPSTEGNDKGLDGLGSLRSLSNLIRWAKRPEASELTGLVWARAPSRTNPRDRLLRRAERRDREPRDRPKRWGTGWSEESEAGPIRSFPPHCFSSVGLIGPPSLRSRLTMITENPL